MHTVSIKDIKICPIIVIKVTFYTNFFSSEIFLLNRHCISMDKVACEFPRINKFFIIRQ